MNSVFAMITLLFSAGFCYIFYRIVSDMHIDKKLTIPDIACMVMAVIIAFCVGIAGYFTAVPIALGMGVIIWSLIQIFSIKSLMKDGVFVTARVVDYHVKTRVAENRSRNYQRYQKNNKYQVYAPVMEYETVSGTIRADYPVFDRERWYQEQDEWLIYYNPSQPEFFWFPERTKEMTSQYWELMIMTFIVMFGAIVLP